MNTDLLLQAYQLKSLSRAGWVRSGIAHPESVAAHSWGMSFLCLTLCPEELNTQRVLELAILHDLVEVHTGDITPHDPVSKAEKKARERKAALQLFAERHDFLAIWQEYEDHQTAESRFVHQIDKLDMALQAIVYEQNEDFDGKEFIDSAKRAVHDPSLQTLLKKVLDRD